MAVNRSWQMKILERAKQEGTLGELYWYIVSTAGREDRALTIARSLPVIPMGDDPEQSRHDAHLLLELCSREEPTKALRLEITTLDLIREFGLPWFVWGDHDHVCPGCGAIGSDCICVPLRELTPEEQDDWRKVRTADGTKHDHQFEGEREGRSLRHRPGRATAAGPDAQAAQGQPGDRGRPVAVANLPSD